MEIPEQYRPCKELADLYVDSEGNFIYRGKPKAVIRPVSRHGKKLTARLTIKYYNVTGYALLCHVKYVHELQLALKIVKFSPEMKV